MEQLTGKAAELAREYQQILDSPTYDTDDNYEKTVEIELEMQDLGYTQNSKRQWVKTSTEV
jgi:hypothetical protein